MQKVIGHPMGIAAWRDGQPGRAAGDDQGAKRGLTFSWPRDKGPILQAAAKHSRELIFPTVHLGRHHLQLRVDRHPRRGRHPHRPEVRTTPCA